MNALDVIDQLPIELAARLESDEFFDDIPVIIAEDGDIEKEIARKQALITGKSGRVGIAVIVLQVVAEDRYPEITFGPMELSPAFQVVENLELNRGARGTGKTARRVARRIRDVIKSCGLNGVTTDFVPGSPAIEPLNFGEALGKLIRGYQVNFVTFEADTESLSQCDMPAVAAGETNEVTLSCGTADAVIYYSTDDSYPSKASGTIYTGPIAVPEAGMVLRAVGTKTGLLDSQVMRAAVAATPL